MGLCSQCIHHLTQDKKEYVESCAKCRDRDKFVKRVDAEVPSNNNMSNRTNMGSAGQSGFQSYAGQKDISQNNAVNGALSRLQSGGQYSWLSPYQVPIQGGMQNVGQIPNQMPLNNGLQNNLSNIAQNLNNILNSGANTVNAQNGLNQSKEKAEEIALRDKIALVALQNPSINITFSSPSDIATICYAIADAMLAQRENQNNQ